jgi:hypothetical protein
MNRQYDDILSRIPEPPAFWQQGGIPRYGTFDPEASSDVYSNELALVEIACQFCRKPFTVLIETAGHDRRIAEAIRAGTLHYGDPPNTGCCGGVSAGSLALRVLQYWAKAHPEHVEDGLVVDVQGFFEWRRDPSLEVELPG